MFECDRVGRYEHSVKKHIGPDINMVCLLTTSLIPHSVYSNTYAFLVSSIFHGKGSGVFYMAFNQMDELIVHQKTM